MDARETTLYAAVLIAAIVLGCLLGYFLVSIIRIHRRYLRLHQSQNQQQVMLIEKERTRIAADLHDDLGPVLSAAKFKLTGVDPQDQESQELLQQASDHIDRIVGRIRELSNGLMPNTLLRRGPVPAIEELIHSMSQPDDLHIEFVAGDIPRLPNEQAIHIYRIVQELIHNTRKHARASKLTIHLHQQQQRLLLNATDNGIGFDVAAVSENGTGLGLRNLLNRTEMLGGNMYIISKPGKGTEIVVEIPLNFISHEANQ